MQFVTDLSSLLSVVAALAGGIHLLRARRRRGWFVPLTSAFLLFATWTITVSLYQRAPFSSASSRLMLSALCGALAPWPLVLLTFGARSVRTTLRSWRAILTVQICISAICAAVAGLRGIDWVTGIGAEPLVLLSRSGLWAVALAAVPGFAGAVLFALRSGGLLAAMPGAAVGTFGVLSGLLWASAGLLWRGYLTPGIVASAATMGGVGAAVWAVGVLRHLPAAQPLAPSRRLVYAAAGLGLVLSYVIVARFALNWVAAIASAALPSLLPAMIFAAAAALIVMLGSSRVRHRLWVAVGRHLFQSKHDYGAVWVQLTKLVTEARNAGDLLQRAAAFCGDVLCVPAVTVWLTDAAGCLYRAAVAAPGRGAIEIPPAGVAAAERLTANGSTVPTADGAGALAQRLGCAFACPMRVNGRIVGVIAVGGEGQESVLDDEDHRVLEYVSAQVASALELYRLGEEIADAREVGSFHRLSAFVIHDLKNLVAQQSFVLENAEKFRANPAFVADALAAFADSTNRMRSLIGRLRAREPTASSAEGSCDLLELIRELAAQPGLGRRGTSTLSVRAPDDLTSCLVRSDRAAMTQVFTNLLVNAVESLSTDAGEVSVSIESAPGAWQVSVRDSGRGMPEAFVREHLFHPFRSTKEWGLGIGLYQCKTIVEAAGGTIRVQSQERAGTTVVVTLPAAAPAAGPVSALEVPNGQTASLGD